MKRLPLLANLLRHRERWLAVAALLALTPKCVFCVLAYAGIGAALGLGGPEICGAPISSWGPWSSALTLLGLALGSIGFLAGRRPRGPAPSSSVSSRAR